MSTLALRGASRGVRCERVAVGARAARARPVERVVELCRAVGDCGALRARARRCALHGAVSDGRAVGALARVGSVLLAQAYGRACCGWRW